MRGNNIPLKIHQKFDAVTAAVPGREYTTQIYLSSMLANGGFYTDSGTENIQDFRNARGCISLIIFLRMEMTVLPIWLFEPHSILLPLLTEFIDVSDLPKVLCR